MVVRKQILIALGVCVPIVVQSENTDGSASARRLMVRKGGGLGGHGEAQQQAEGEHHESDIVYMNYRL